MFTCFLLNYQNKLDAIEIQYGYQTRLLCKYMYCEIVCPFLFNMLVVYISKIVYQTKLESLWINLI